MHRVGQRVGVLCASFDDPVDHLLGEQRVATGAFGDLVDQFGCHRSRFRALRERDDEISSVHACERCERDRGRRVVLAAPVRATIEELVACQAYEQDRSVRPAREVLDQIEHAFIGPMDVLDDEHQRRPSRRGFDHRSDCRKEAIAHLLRAIELRLFGEREVRGLDAQRAPQGCRQARAGRTRRGAVLVDQCRDPALQFAPRRVGTVVVDDVEGAADNFAKRPVGEAGAVGGTAADPNRGRRLSVADLRRQFTKQSRFAHPRRSDHGRQMWLALVNDLLVEGDQLLGFI